MNTTKLVRSMTCSDKINFQQKPASLNHMPVFGLLLDCKSTSRLSACAKFKGISAFRKDTFTTVSGLAVQGGCEVDLRY